MGAVKIKICAISQGGASMSGNKLAWSVVAVMIAAGAMYFGSFGGNSVGPSLSPPTVAVASSPPNYSPAEPEDTLIAAAGAAPEKVAPDHYYALRDGFEYGYEQALSEDDKNAGTQASPLMMTRFMDVTDGIYTVEIIKGPASAIFTCEYHCEFIKSKQFAYGQLVNSEILRNAKGSVVWAIMQDAQSGKLSPYPTNN